MVRKQTCAKFVCKYHKDSLCTISYTKCIPDKCLCFYGYCDNCIQTGCANSLVNKKEEKSKNNKQSQPHNEKTPIIKEPYAYVDGSFNKGIYGYGCIIVKPDGKKETLKGSGSDKVMAEMRNVAGEIEGAIAAIKYAIDNHFASLTLYYDYIGIEKWADDSWRANKPGTIAYKQFIKECPIPLKFVKVKGHSGVDGNEIADRLAKEAVGVL